MVHSISLIREIVKRKVSERTCDKSWLKRGIWSYSIRHSSGTVLCFALLLLLILFILFRVRSIIKWNCAARYISVDTWCVRVHYRYRHLTFEIFVKVIARALNDRTVTYVHLQHRASITIAVRLMLAGSSLRLLINRRRPKQARFRWRNSELVHTPIYIANANCPYKSCVAHADASHKKHSELADFCARVSPATPATSAHPPTTLIRAFVVVSIPTPSAFRTKSFVLWLQH